MVAWEGHFGALLLEHLGSQVVGKGGAEGVFCGGLVGKGIGFAVKISDGAGRAIAPVVIRLLEQLLPNVPLDGAQTRRAETRQEHARRSRWGVDGRGVSPGCGLGTRHCG